MPERTASTRSKPNLAERVEETLGAIDAACANLSRLNREAEEAEAVKERVAAAAPPPPAPPSAPAPAEPRVVAHLSDAPADLIDDDDFEAALSADLDDLLEETSRAAVSIGNEAAGAVGSESDGESIDEALSDAVDEVFGAEPADQDAPSPTLAGLDDELAGLASAMVDGVFEDAEGQVEPEPTVTRVASSAPAPKATEVPPEAPEPEPAAPAPARPDRLAVFMAHARRVRAALVPLGARVVVLAAAPTARLPASTRDTVGWLGLYTAFLAVCVWGFLLLFRQPVTPEPEAEPVQIIGTASAAE